jgi:hypothetical protein
MTTAMTTAMAALVLALPPAGVGKPAAGAWYERSARVLYVQAALEAVRGTRPEALDQAYNYLAAMERSACASAVERRRVDCLISAARRYCRTRPRGEAQSCALYADVIASNVLVEKHLLTPQQRYEMMRTQKDYRAALKAYVRRVQGTLATDFKLATRAGPAAAELAGHVDGYCLATADVSNLSWQTCVTALIWFIARQP